MKIAVKLVIFLCGSLIIISLLLLTFFTVTAYEPMKEIKLTDISNNREINQKKLNTLKILSWNISKAIYHKRRKITNKEKPFSIVDNLNNIINTLNQEKADVYLIQGVDKHSSQSSYINQVNRLVKAMPEYNAYFSTNHKAVFIPYPIYSPIGKTHSGILTLTDPISIYTKRYSLPQEKSWFNRLFEQNDCISLVKIPTKKENRYWCIINVHLSFDKHSHKELNSKLNFIKEFALKLYNDGNYVICGGDWNLNIINMESLSGKDNKNNIANKTNNNALTDAIPQNWLWAYDLITPSYKSTPKMSHETTRDGFLLSPNINLIEVKALDLDFSNSPHNPVYIKVRTKIDMSIEKSVSPENTKVAKK